MNASDIVATLLRELASQPDVCLVIGSDAAVCEAFVDPETMDFRIDGPYATLENGPWHIHLDMAQVHRVTFEVKPDVAHNRDQLSYSVRFFDAQGAYLLRAFFLSMYDADGNLRPARVQAYETLRSRGGDRDEIVCGAPA